MEPASPALEMIPRLLPDVVLMDINLPDLSGIECVAALKRAHSQIDLVMLTTYDDTDLIFNAVRAGASGYLLKRATPEELLGAISEARRGGSPMSMEIARRVVSGHIGGLQMLEPGYKKSRVAPLVGHGGLSAARASLRTPYGILMSDWTYEKGQLTLAVEIPVNTTEEVIIPTRAPNKVLESGVDLRSTAGVQVLSYGKGRLALSVGSGRYKFHSAN